jgi:hypothetical protein
MNVERREIPTQVGDEVKRGIELLRNERKPKEGVGFRLLPLSGICPDEWGKRNEGGWKDG